VTIKLSSKLLDDPVAGIVALQAATLRLTYQQQERAQTVAEFVPYPHQIPPESDWDIWMLRGGRGSGKTEAGARSVLRHINEYHGKPYEFRDDNNIMHRGTHRCRIGIGAPTIGDVRDTCIEGQSGLLAILGDRVSEYNRTLQELRTTDGALIKGYGSENPARWNGPQFCFEWWDELGLVNKEAFDQAQFGLRLYQHPRLVATTTPKRRKWLRQLEDEEGTVVTVGRTIDNVALDPKVQKRLLRKYGGKPIGKQELMGEYSFEVEGAMWSEVWIEESRVTRKPDVFQRIAVAIDPAGQSTNEEGAQTGIVCGGLGMDGDVYIWHAEGVRMTPGGWGRRAVHVHDREEADCIVAEANYGGEMVESTIRSCINKGAMPPRIKIVHASRGKTIRAEPVAALYQEGRIHHVGVLEELEEQLCTFPVASELKDQLDAMVWLVAELWSNGHPDDWNELAKPSNGHRKLAPEMAGMRGRAF
jgi:phage terminase large subunit-like protein